ncbi:hypothetical protein niasHS_006968 [Heterodera schachtii]|uniref:Integrase catalytic domain-containing protein n=1 Tax=Heterodera schachtii TaxID=97005 RepID=A0ABD2JF93_HETSC
MASIICFLLRTIPMSNGQAERFVDTFKRTCRKIRGEGASEMLTTFLATYLTTPCEALPECKCPAEMFLRRKPRTTLDLLRPKPKAPIIRDEAMKRQFNRRHGAKPRSFALGDKILARHRLSQPWRPGKITKCKGLIYDVEFLDGKFGRFHANQLLVRSTDENGTDALNVLNDAFDLPLAPPLVQHGGQAQLPVVAPAAVIAPAVAEQLVVEEADRAPEVPDQRRSQRKRRPPDRYSP